MRKGPLKVCHRLCIKENVSCPNNDCKMWIDYEEDLNCTLENLDYLNQIKKIEHLRKLNTIYS